MVNSFFYKLYKFEKFICLNTHTVRKCSAIPNLSVLASPEAKSQAPFNNPRTISFIYNGIFESGNFRLEIRHRAIPPGRNEFWNNIYEFALASGGGKLDEVIAKFRKNKLFYWIDEHQVSSTIDVI